SHQTLAGVVAVAVARSTRQIAASLQRGARLVTSALLVVARTGDVYERLEVDARLLDVIAVRGLSPEVLMQRFLPAAPVAALSPGDYPHLREEIELAALLLSAALADRRRGINVLLHGPTGTGKSE